MPFAHGAAFRRHLAGGSVAGGEVARQPAEGPQGPGLGGNRTAGLGRLALAPGSAYQGEGELRVGPGGEMHDPGVTDDAAAYGPDGCAPASCLACAFPVDHHHPPGMRP